MIIFTFRVSIFKNEVLLNLTKIYKNKYLMSGYNL